jgi:tyrosine-protein kinase Etk/Wzc
MNSFSNDDLTLVTFSDLKFLFLRHLSKIKWVSIFCGSICFALLLLREPRYIAEATFKQTVRQNEIGLGLKESYQHLLSFPSDGATIPIMQSNEVLKDVVEDLGMQVVCNSDAILIKAMKRIIDNLSLELGKSLPDPDPFTFRDVSYRGEKPVKMFLKLIDKETYQMFDQNKRCVGEGTLGKPFALSMATWTLNRVPNMIKLNRLYPITIHPRAGAIGALRCKLKVVPWKQDKVILKLIFSCRDRFLAADVLNQVMKNYQKYLKRENDESCQLQLAYLHQREQELTQHYDAALIDHVDYLKENLSTNGFIGVSQEIEILSQPKHIYTSKLFDVDLELQRLDGRRDDPVFSIEDDDSRQSHQNHRALQQGRVVDEKKIRDAFPYLNERKQLENRLEDCDLDQKRSEGMLTGPIMVEIEEVAEQIREAKSLLQCVEKQEEIPPFPSLLKEPKSAIALLVKQMSESKALMDVREGAESSTVAITYVREFIDHLFQKRRILEENLTLQRQEPHDFSGLNLATAQELLVGYTRERDNLQAQMRELVFLRDQLSHADFEMSSLGGVFSDSVTADLVQKASAMALQLKDDSNRSDREQIRLQDALQIQKSFLSQYLFQTIELKKLRSKLLDDKITSLRRTTASLLQSEKLLLQNKLHELNQKMSDLPEKWRRESLLMLKKELGSMMLQGVSQLAETKNLGQHIFQTSSKPLDAAIPPTQVNPPKIFIFSFFSSLLAGICFYGFIFCKNMLKGFPATEENLKVSGFPISGSLSKDCNTHFSQLNPKDLETLRRVAAFLISQPRQQEALLASCIGGKYPDYTLSLAELLSMRGLRVLSITCVFDRVVHVEDMPGLWQYLHGPSIDLPLRRHLSFDHLPSGGTTRHAAELIGSAKFSSFLSRMRQKYDVILLFSSADAATAEGYAFLPIADSVIITVQQEKKEELLVYVDWAEKKGIRCATFVSFDELS